MSISKYYTESVAIVSVTPDTGWSTDETRTTHATIDCGISQIAGRERYIGDAPQILADYRVFSEVTTDVDTTRRAVWKGVDYEIVESPKDVMQLGHHYEWLIRKIDA